MQHARERGRRRRMLGGALACLCAASCDPAAPRKAGAQIFAEQGCITCHGTQKEGTVLGPSLAGAGSRWKAADLVRYLKDPQAYAASDERLSAQAQRFSLPMPRYNMLAPEDLEALAAHIIGAR